MLVLSSGESLHLAAKQPTMQRTTPTTKNYVTPNVNTTEAETPSSPALSGRTGGGAETNKW